METILILRGDILYNKNQTELITHKDSYLVSINGKIEGIYSLLPDKFRNCPVENYRDCLIIPGLIDLHIHAPQYAFRGIGMDLELLEWLEKNVFKEESKYHDLVYAKAAYQIFSKRMKRSATTRACIFGTIHKDATLLLMDFMEQTGLYTMVGKVNMDRNSPTNLCEESAKKSFEETLFWIKEAKIQHYHRTFPIITPRFYPSCSEELMLNLSELQKDYELPLQSHLSENISEIKWVEKLSPHSTCYGDAYHQVGLFGTNGKTIMAHCVHSTEQEIKLLKENHVFVAHCPESNMNLSSGIAPIRKYLDAGISVGLGTDVAAGTSENMFSAMAHAIQASKLRCRLIAPEEKPLTVAEVLYLATIGGGAFFGKVGSFKPGYDMDAIILNDYRIQHLEEYSLEKRLERLLYLGDEREVVDKYVQGEKIRQD